MKNNVSKMFTCLLFSVMLSPAFAQQSQATPQVTDQNIKNTNAASLARLMSSIEALTTLPDDVKARLEAALSGVIEKSEKARSEMKDDSNLQAWREAKVADIKAQLKAILTPEQYELVLKGGSK